MFSPAKQAKELSWSHTKTRQPVPIGTWHPALHFLPTDVSHQEARRLCPFHQLFSTIPWSRYSRIQQWQKESPLNDSYIIVVSLNDYNLQYGKQKDKWFSTVSTSFSIAKSTRQPTVLKFCWSTYGLPVLIMVILLSDIPAAVDLNRTWSGPLLLCLCWSSPTFFYKANPPASICWLNCCRPETHHEWDYLSGATSLCHKVDSLSTRLCEALVFF